MQILDLRNKIGKSSLSDLGLERPVMEQAELEKIVLKILKQVKTKRDRAIKSLTQLLDNVRLKKLAVTEKEIQAADKLVNEELKQAIKLAASNIRKFHEA